MRKRFNSKRICSSESYESSIHAHQNDLARNHQSQIIVEISKTIVIKKGYYTKVFGKIINIQESELSMYEGFTIYTY
jgi:hypothetical protein